MERIGALETEIADGRLRRITSVLAAREGRLRYEAYFDPGGADALRNTRSVTKTVASLLVGIAIDRGEIAGIDTPLLSFFDDLAPIAHDGPAKRAVTLRDVLTMSSALDCDDGDPESPGNEEVMYETADWLRFALDIPMRTDGGGGFRYCTAGVTALAGVLERATGRTLEAYAEDHLFAPIGIVGARWFRSPTGLVQTGGGLELRSRDLLALGQLALDGGSRHGRRIVSEAWIEASLRPAVRVDPSTSYGYLWWLRPFTLDGGSVDVALMQGNGGSKVAVVPELRGVAVITSTNFGTPGMHEQTDRILERHVLPFLAAAS
jgi:CubicO group peptidase (beta-lactamase class C family)